MDAERIKATLQAKLGVEMDFKLEWDAFRFLLFGKMFAMLGYNKQQEKILTLKLPPQEGTWYRDEYAFITHWYAMHCMYVRQGHKENEKQLICIYQGSCRNMWGKRG